MNNYIYEYYQAMWNGSVTVGHWIRALYDKIMAGLEDGTYHFNQKKANNAIRFVEKYVRHNKGKLGGQLLTLELWQKAALSCIYGIVDENDHRQFREVFMVIGRKMGKTLFAAAIIAYEAYVDGEFGSEIYCVAPKLDQSDLVYSAFEFTKDNTPVFKAMTKKRKTDLYVQKTNTTIKKIAFNEKKADGYNPMLTVADEMSSWPAVRGLKQYEVMISGTGAREEPLTLAISSSGYEDNGIYDELMSRSTRFLKGDSREKRLLPFLYMIDDTNKWDDINELRKSLPGMGVSVSVDFILDQIDIAAESLSKKAEFMTKYCNIKQNSSQAWLESTDIEACYGDLFDLEDFRGSYCVGGIDLSRTTDLTVCCVVIEKKEKLYVLMKFFLPSAKIQDAIKRDNMPYDIFIERGLLKPSGENFVDYHDCFDWFRELVETYEILPLQVGYDRYSAQYLVQDMEAYGFHMDDVFQGTNLTPVINETEGMIKDQKIRIGTNDLLKAHMLDSALKINNVTDRKKLVKIYQTAHIDGMAALLDAMCVRQKWYGEIGSQLRN
ncbi:MAG TPA: terminase large subunit [Erysipelotrichaceae bacterium]|nr:terminase large subunit [Erysipelotrichaceae bacterium]